MFSPRLREKFSVNEIRFLLQFLPQDYPTTRKNGKKCFIRKAICFTPTLMYGTNPMTFALNSAQSVSARSAAVLKELREVRYDENNH